MNSVKFQSNDIKTSSYDIKPNRGQYYNIEEVLQNNRPVFDNKLLVALNQLDIIYRTLCGILFNYVPRSGHPGGSISSGHIIHALMYCSMDYNFSDPDALDADNLCYGAGHKALGLYAAWALRNECARIGHSEILPDTKYQLRLEDLLGFRRNPISDLTLFNKYHAKPLDGHPTPATPFVRLATGASGVGMTTATGTAFALLDLYGKNAPWMNILEGEGGMTPGRVQEAMATAASAQIKNIILHVDWNQSSIDSDRVCRDGNNPGDYVQWTPTDLAYVNDWNVITVPDGFDFQQILAAQIVAQTKINNNQPTAIIYRTTKGWKYGIEGRKSHGAGHDFCSQDFYGSLKEFEEEFGDNFPRFEGDQCSINAEESFFDCLMTIRATLEKNRPMTQLLSDCLVQANNRLKETRRQFRIDAPTLENIYSDKLLTVDQTPKELALKTGQSVTHRGVLADTLAYLNHQSNGALIGSAADLFGSTNLSNIAKGLSDGYFNFEKNPKARLIQTGGICEDAMGGFMAGLSAQGHHIGVGSSYAAFIAALQHVPARLHAIGQQARVHTFGGAYNPFFIICAHAGPKTGEDGPTHADPQALQLLQENFPRGTLITLTPWDTQETWPLIAAALKARPAIIAPFVTRPSENVVDRKAFSLPPASLAAKGVYALRKTDATDKTIVLQGNGVGNEFVTKVLPRLDQEGIQLNIFYITSAELFDLLSTDEQEKILPETLTKAAMGITEFTLPTLYRWITSLEGRKHSLYPFKKGHFLGSGQAEIVFKEAGLDADAQYQAIVDQYL